MSDVDDFALQLLQRAQARQKVISENLNKENSSDDKSTIDNMIKKISETSPKKKDMENSDNSCRILNLSSSPRRSPLKNQNLIVNEELHRPCKESVTDLKQPVELFVMKPIESEVEEDLSDSDGELSLEEEINTEEVEQIPACFKTPVMSGDTSGGVIKSETKRTLKRLGQLYGDVTIASPVHKHSELEKTPEFTPNQINQSRASPVARRSRLNALAHNINNWEDDLSHHCSPTSRFNMSVTPKVGRSGSPPKPFSSQASAETNNMVRKNAYTTSRNSVTVTPNSKVSNNICTPKVITEVYSDACESKGDGVNGTPLRAQLLDVEPLCVSSKKDRGLIIQRKMYLENNETADNSQNSSRAHAWDDSLLTALEAQGFVPTPAKDKMVYHFSNPPAGSRASPTRSSPIKQQANSPRNSSISKSPIKSTANLNASKISPSKLVSTTAAASPEKTVDDTPRVVNSIRKKFEFGGRSPNKSTSEKAIFKARAVETPRAKASVAQRAILYESNLNKSVMEKDPTELSVAERTKLFERQTFSRPTKTGSGTEPPKPVRTFNALTAGLVYTPLKPKAEVVQPSITKDIKPLSPQRSPAKKQEEEMCPSPPPPPQLPPSVAITSPSRNKRYSKSPTPKPKRSMSPPKSQYPGCRDVKRIKINEPKDGHMYPSLTDIEATETETDVVTETETEDEPMYEDEDMDSETSQLSASSLGTHIQQVAKLSSPAKSPLRSPPRRNRHYRPTEDFSASLACRQIDAYIDEALEGQDFTLDTMMENELEAHASSTPIANASMDNSDDTALVTMIPDETRNPKQLDFEDDAQDAENEKANSSFGSFATSRPDITEEHVLTETDETYKADVPNDSVVSFSCLDDSDSDYDEANAEFKKPVPRQEPDPLSTSSPHGYGQNHKESSPAHVNTPLLHTVSFYRRQQSKNYATLTPTAHFKAAEKANEKNTMEKKEDVSEQIRKLEDEVSGHVKSIAQVSKALNLCKATVEFSESTENVECEKVLLIATQKRTALVNEIHRLKTEGVLSKKTLFSPGKHDLGPSCRGNMTLSNVEVQLKRDFMSRAMKGDAVYHFVLLTKYRHQVEASSLVSVGNGVSSSNIQGGVLHFPNEFTIENLEPEFSVKVEIYLLQTQKEYLPHEAKYHIKKEPKTGILTPKKLKMDAHTAKYLGRPFQQSPAGPDSIKTTNFSLCGNLTIDISTLQRSHWSLEKNMTVCPLEGSVSIKIQCSAEGGIEEKGFLTLFDDVSGFGAWHRRWCKLTPSQLAYWRYPEDETKKEPLGTISLRKCVTNRVGPVARDVCARANTFLLVTTRSPYVDDKDTLVTSCHTEYTAVRHLLSADTKEERDLWCKQFNRALANLRAWDPQAHSPDDTLF